MKPILRCRKVAFHVEIGSWLYLAQNV